MEFTATSSSSRFSKGDAEDAEQEEPSRREIPFMTAAASSSAAASASVSASGGSSPPFRSGDGGAGASGSGGGGGGDAEAAEAVEKEHMFDKVVTPSDVGKLNRLVIPKQYAEKYFPLDSAANEKGLLLNFEDSAGKPWRFRYSYWNSSQSYVMTKGWSRFVKEKRLDAGDTVSFSRGARAAADRLFIDWKRRADSHRDHHHPLLRFPGRLSLPMMPLASHYSPWGVGGSGGRSGFFLPPSPPATLYEHRLRQGFDFRGGMNPAMGLGIRQPQLLLFGSATSRMPPHHAHAPPLLLPRAPPLHHYTLQQSTAAGPSSVVLDSVPVIESPTTTATKKRVRLFGVNLDNPHSSGNGAGGDGESSNNHGGRTLSSSLQMPASAAWRPRDPTLRLLEFPSHGAESSPGQSSPSSSSSSKRDARSSALDLDL
ncbi:B3 domain-containing protein Os02g0683500 [Brachypodium distachyon]|uniref:TF-B3 domain-containing protein n=1 Tax=Brachypodium distachyon TaxID=15368 RepID=A0A0Q3I4L9_BRADI|nr:B3 domain-containing protein Os02g0683500 [Brachypodium distachyon]KQK00795.1 hypothetical protein BRADI_3g51840v3 [Brachypodium distachyon]PNT69241.1 hypothetical protein BRADI_3g51840v3 [Brachypodium distachyon]|eukprot:XP_014755835.1 B3 domain-containing protein Os02g0683500 [Brachypodium distachyon]